MSILDQISRIISILFAKFRPFTIPLPNAHQEATSASLIESFLPQSIEEVPEYRAAFEHALQFSRSCGFNNTDVSWLDENLLSEDGIVIKLALQAAGVISMDGAPGQCLKWSHFLTPFFAQEVGCAAWLTLGQLWKDNGPIHDPNWIDLRRWSEQGIQMSDFQGRKGFNLHAWITLQSGEIIDPTYFSTLARYVPGYESVAGVITHGRDPHVVSQHRYYPMALGSEFAEAIASRSVLPLLAHTADDLRQVGAVAIFN